MCGICGIYSPGGRFADPEAVRRMRARLAHRGPDDEGEHFDGPIGLGFRRLSILDISGGHQPMSTPDDRLTLVFNGEIYNHPELRVELTARGVNFRTRSDTETILELYAREGAQAFRRLNGMFALALWDKEKEELTLARDPFGIKPLYYSFDGSRLVFSSEVRSLLAGGLIADDLEPSGILEYLSYGKVHGPRTVFRRIKKLPPAHYLRLSRAGSSLNRYWDFPGGGDRQAPALQDGVETLDGLLSQAVRDHCLSDVPVGVFLSGGLDSSLVAAMMARQNGAKKISSFSVGFEGAALGVDESAHARRVAKWLGAEHHEVMISRDILAGLEGAAGLLDEPIADSAILPTYLLARHAREKVKVVLTGEGADELFAGYGRYKAAWINEGLWNLPPWAHVLAAPLARCLGKGAVFKNLPISKAGDWARLSEGVDSRALESILTPEFSAALQVWPGPAWPTPAANFRSLNSALAFDFQTILPDSLLMKVDKSTMRCSLEARVPFLDKRVVEYAAGLPASFKMRRFKGKYILRLVAERYLPQDIVWRRKHGFIVPWESWVRSPDNAAIKRLLADSGSGFWEIFDRPALSRGPGADAGLFFRVVLLGLWLQSLRPAPRVYA